METNPTSQPPDEAVDPSGAPGARAIARGYETSTVSIRALLLVLLGTGVVCGVMGIGVWYLQRDLLRSTAADDRPVSMIRVTARDNGSPPLQPSGPTHDTTPAQDLVALRASEDAVFSDVGWKSRDDGSIVVPPDVLQAVESRTAAKVSGFTPSPGTPGEGRDGGLQGGAYPRKASIGWQITDEAPTPTLPRSTGRGGNGAAGSRGGAP